uniref:Uncharacterized protein n=1 Tax=Ceratitis capitata TaxID=7213 RepID=W8CBG1_CERCA
MPLKVGSFIWLAGQQRIAIFIRQHNNGLWLGLAMSSRTYERPLTAAFTCKLMRSYTLKVVSVYLSVPITCSCASLVQFDVWLDVQATEFRTGMSHKLLIEPTPPPSLPSPLRVGLLLSSAATTH